MNKRLRNVRQFLGLTQDYVAGYMGLTRPTISMIESGRRKVTADELERFAKLYDVSVDELLYGWTEEIPEINIFDKNNIELSDIDRKEIINLIVFKKDYKEHVNA